jgi:pimeloyl-ACP methyl ester carboxylesterase
MSERSIVFGENNSLVGTISLPTTRRGDIKDIGCLLFNAGIIHRIGPHRINVRIARQLADNGLSSIRFDLSGHGDSARPSGDKSFEDQALIDVRAAIDALAVTANARRFAIFGFCSGAYHAFAAALADERVSGILLLDAYRYPTAKTHLFHYWNRLRQHLALNGPLAVIQRAVASIAEDEAARHHESPAPELGRINFIPPKEEFAKGLNTLLARGVNIHMIYSGGTIREYNYPDQFRDTFRRFGVADRIKADFLSELDHAVTGLADQADLVRRVIEWCLSLGIPSQHATVTR